MSATGAASQSCHTTPSTRWQSGQSRGAPLCCAQAPGPREGTGAGRRNQAAELARRANGRRIALLGRANQFYVYHRWDHGNLEQFYRFRLVVGISGRFSGSFDVCLVHAQAPILVPLKLPLNLPLKLPIKLPLKLPLKIPVIQF